MCGFAVASEAEGDFRRSSYFDRKILADRSRESETAEKFDVSSVILKALAHADDVIYRISNSLAKLDHIGVRVPDL